MLTLTEQNFDKEVLKSSVPVLVDFFANWCGPCRILSPIVEELAEEYKGKAVKIASLNIDESPEIASRFGIMSIPTLIFFKNGKADDQLVGAQDKRKLQSKIESLLKF